MHRFLSIKLFNFPQFLEKEFLQKMALFQKNMFLKLPWKYLSKILWKFIFPLKNHFKNCPQLALVAQTWADQCKVGHDTARQVKRFSVGQNVFIQMVSTGQGKMD
jgi:hypothetical protein